MAIVSSECGPGMAAVSNIAGNGISTRAQQNGSSYKWGNAERRFCPTGGVYNLCWCANMGTTTCPDLNNNFLLSAGQLIVAGPFIAQLEPWSRLHVTFLLIFSVKTISKRHVDFVLLSKV